MLELANILRPKKLEEFVGQKHIVSRGTPFFKLLKKRILPHSFFFGPPGSGKTTLARIISSELQYDFFEFNATSLKVDEIRKVIKNYENSLIKALIFIDEIHRLSKNQQEIILPFMEKNQALFIGASTENPFFSLTPAIRSRSTLFEFFYLTDEDLTIVLEKAIKKTKAKVEDDAKDYIITSSGGDARAMLNLFEMAQKIENPITLKTIKSIRANPIATGVKDKDTHYNLISAFIKSIRGSDLDASIYYLARLIEEGEDIKFIARRLIILASEDIGNANPNALNLSVSCYEAISNIGLPEARIILSQTVIYLASSPKSNSAISSIDNAIAKIKEGNILKVPEYLKDNHSFAKEKNSKYKNPHNFGGYVKQKYLEKDLELVKLSDIGFEKRLQEWIMAIKK